MGIQKDGHQRPLLATPFHSEASYIQDRTASCFLVVPYNWVKSDMLCELDGSSHTSLSNCLMDTFLKLTFFLR